MGVGGTASKLVVLMPVASWSMAVDVRTLQVSS